MQKHYEFEMALLARDLWKEGAIQITWGTLYSWLGLKNWSDRVLEVFRQKVEEVSGEKADLSYRKGQNYCTIFYSESVKKITW
jgi:hypothetical protein